MPRKKQTPQEPVTEVKLRIPESLVARIDADCKALRTTRNGYFHHLLDLAAVAMDRHRLAEAIASLHSQLWDLHRLAENGGIDRDLAKQVATRIESTAQEITRKLRAGE